MKRIVHILLLICLALPAFSKQENELDIYKAAYEKLKERVEELLSENKKLQNQVEGFRLAFERQKNETQRLKNLCLANGINPIAGTESNPANYILFDNKYYDKRWFETVCEMKMDEYLYIDNKLYSVTEIPEIYRIITENEPLKVSQITSSGILVSGSSMHVQCNPSGYTENSFIGNCCLKQIGPYSYVTVSGSSRVIDNYCFCDFARMTEENLKKEIEDGNIFINLEEIIEYKKKKIEDDKLSDREIRDASRNARKEAMDNSNQDESINPDRSFRGNSQNDRNF